MAITKKKGSLTSVKAEVDAQIDALTNAKAALNVAETALANARRTAVTFGKGSEVE